jgi:hypothetical protein
MQQKLSYRSYIIQWWTFNGTIVSDAFNVFIWIDAGAESTAFLDGGSIEEAPCISARLPSWERSGIWWVLSYPTKVVFREMKVHFS